jgi:hypothetical protein
VVDGAGLDGVGSLRVVHSAAAAAIVDVDGEVTIPHMAPRIEAAERYSILQFVYEYLAWV